VRAPLPLRSLLRPSLQTATSVTKGCGYSDNDNDSGVGNGVGSGVATGTGYSGIGNSSDICSGIGSGNDAYSSNGSGVCSGSGSVGDGDGDGDGDGGEEGSVYAPIDLEAGGTWLSYNKQNHRFAVVLNYHESEFEEENVKKSSEEMISRGFIPGMFTDSSISPSEFIDDLKKSYHRMSGFSLIFGDHEGCHYVSNKCPDSPVKLAPHVLHGFSNGALHDEPSAWPRIGVGKSVLTAHIEDESLQLTSMEKSRNRLRQMIEDFKSNDYETNDPALRSSVHARLILPPTVCEEIDQLYGTRTLTAITTFEEEMDGDYDASGESGDTRNVSGGMKHGVYILESDCDPLSSDWSEDEHILFT
jgi:uncharacterized protein with NRDE domain